MTHASPLPFLCLAAVLACAACERETVNPPTEPAAPITGEGSTAPPPAPPPGLDPIMPGAGPANIVGRWAAQRAWCANTSGPEQAITISTLRFEGYENSCAISSLDQVDGGYEATLACASEGTTTRERVRMAAQGDSMRLTWLNRNNAVVQLVRCPASPEPTG